MPDITKCPGDNCPIRGDCYRYTAPPSDMQSYMAAPGYQITSTIKSEDGKWECDFYLPEKLEAKR